MALEYLVHADLAVPCTHYFEDFTFVAPEKIAEEVDEMVREFFETL